VIPLKAAVLLHRKVETDLLPWTDALLPGRHPKWGWLGLHEHFEWFEGAAGEHVNFQEESRSMRMKYTLLVLAPRPDFPTGAAAANVR